VGQIFLVELAVKAELGRLVEVDGYISRITGGRPSMGGLHGNTPNRA
jgi:hypothetical protein